MEGGSPTIVTNAEGGRTTPSVVAYAKNGDRLVGQVRETPAAPSFQPPPLPISFPSLRFPSYVASQPSLGAATTRLFVFRWAVFLASAPPILTVARGDARGREQKPSFPRANSRRSRSQSPPRTNTTSPDARRPLRPLESLFTQSANQTLSAQFHFPFSLM